MTIRPKVQWKRYDGYECSSKGDSRFSAYFAVMPDGNTIEFHYQCGIKSYPTIAEGKGKPPLNDMSREDLWQAYLALWRTWAEYNQDLIQELREAIACEKYNYTLSDRFATSDINQARALAQVLNEMI